MKRPSEIDTALAALRLGFTLLPGPTFVIVTGIWGDTVSHVTNLPPLPNPFGRDDTNVMQGWTAIYWAWRISWSPFVGMFTRASRAGARGASSSSASS